MSDRARLLLALLFLGMGLANLIVASTTPGNQHLQSLTGGMLVGSGVVQLYYAVRDRWR